MFQLSSLRIESEVNMLNQDRDRGEPFAANIHHLKLFPQIKLSLAIKEFILNSRKQYRCIIETNYNLIQSTTTHDIASFQQSITAKIRWVHTWFQHSYSEQWMSKIVRTMMTFGYYLCRGSELGRRAGNQFRLHQSWEIDNFKSRILDCKAFKTKNEFMGNRVEGLWTILSF